MTPEQHIAAARRVNPRAYLESMGYMVIGNDERGHLVVDNLMRLDRKPEGHWVACDWHGKAIGDNISLIQYLETQKGFSDAVYSLLGSEYMATAQSISEPPVPQRPRLPAAKPSQRIDGRHYLQERGISLQTIQRAEHAGMLRYGPNSVIFLGRDGMGQIRSATKRMLTPEPSPHDATTLINKRDFAHSDKSFPAILSGQLPARTLHLVEGGVDALALQDIAQRRNAYIPTVIVTGGARVQRFLDNPDVQVLLQNVDRVVVHTERESRPDVQQQTDTDHAKQVQRIRALRIDQNPATVTTWKPPQGKDLADYNHILQRRVQALQQDSQVDASIKPPSQTHQQRTLERA